MGFAINRVKKQHFNRYSDKERQEKEKEETESRGEEKEKKRKNEKQKKRKSREVAGSAPEQEEEDLTQTEVRLEEEIWLEHGTKVAAIAIQTHTNNHVTGYGNKVAHY